VAVDLPSVGFVRSSTQSLPFPHDIRAGLPDPSRQHCANSHMLSDFAPVEHFDPHKLCSSSAHLFKYVYAFAQMYVCACVGVCVGVYIFLERELGNNYKRGEVKEMEVWRKPSKSSVK
jgi:hypothetical protein